MTNDARSFRDQILDLVEATDTLPPDDAQAQTQAALVLALIYLGDQVAGPPDTVTEAPAVPEPSPERPVRPVAGTGPSCDSVGRITSTAEPKTFLESVKVPCALELDHEGDHVFHVEWRRQK